MKNQNQNPEVVVIDKSLNRTDYINNQEGEYRAIVKVQAGWMTVVDDLGLQANWGKKQWNSARDVFRGFKKGALQTIQFKAEGSNHWLTVFSRTGNKVKLIDNALLASLEVGDINQNWSNSNLYNQYQYQAVGAKTWACKAYVKNI
jgi:hypothetical protein